MSKYININGEKEEIIKTDPDIISDNLINAKNEFSIDKYQYSVLEYTEDYMNNLLKTIEKANNNWNNLLDIAIAYQDEVNNQNINK